ncbi:MAG: COPII coat Sec23p-Sfb3p heterodimer component [Bathelium mastoideum]|nr:MAG: COPII coat Sec23p-Sfb3p heterodimer component [Bathelium mastoideum]
MSQYPVPPNYPHTQQPYQGQGDPSSTNPQFRPPVAPHPGGYQQTGATYPNGAPNQQYMQNAPQGYSAPPQDEGYYSQQQSMQLPQQPPVGQPDMGSLTSQMGGMNMGTDSTGGYSSQSMGRPRKKKDRHAHHTIEQPAGASQAFTGMPQGGGPYANQYASQYNQNTGQAPNQFAGGAASAYAPGGTAISTEPPQPAGSPLVGATIQSSQGRVDPEQIPSVPRSRDVPAAHFLEHVYPTIEQHLPPPAAIPFVAFDQGNASPKFTRLTLNNIPASHDHLSSTGLPLGLMLQPLASLQEGEQPIPVLDYGDAGPPRCRRCRTYINPFMTFRSGGNKFVCNMCTFPNDVAPEYFSPTDPNGVRIDRMQRPELHLGTVEFMVPKEYWAKEPVGLRWLFLVDVSAEAINRGFLDGVCEGILNALYGTSDPSVDEEEDQGANDSPKGRLPKGSKVGIVTFDREVHFYNLSSRLSQAQMMVMSDVEDAFVPLSEGLFVDPTESRKVITSLVKELPNMFSQVKSPEPALLPSLDAAMAALSKTGGKIICSLASLPTWGPGRLFVRDDGKMHGNDAEKKLFTTEHAEWKRTANRMVEAGVGVDFFMAAPSGGYLDIATIGHVSGLSGGEVYYYPNFHAPRDTLKLSNEIKHTLTRETGYQALMKVRCSNGLQVSAYHGNFLQHTFGADLEFGTIDADKALAVMFSYDGKLDPRLDAHFQSALLYTTASGERRVRCSNIVASVSDGAMEAMKFVDQDAVTNVIAREAASRMTERSLKDIRSALTEKTVDILAGYRKNFSGSHPPGQLVLPENLKEFSMYMLGLVKSRAFKGGREPTDRRVHDSRMMKSMGLAEMSYYLYPRIYSIHNLEEQDGFANEKGHLRMPHSIRASFSKIEEGGAYIVDNGQVCLLWLHAQVSPNLLEDLFGPDHTDLQSLDPFMSQLPVLQTHLNAQVRNVLQYLEGTRGSKALTIQLARQGLDGAEFEFARLLYEDRNNEAQSYVDWLVHLHRHIQLELAGQRKKEDTSGEATALAGFAGLRAPYWT